MATGMQGCILVNVSHVCRYAVANYNHIRDYPSTGICSIIGQDVHDALLGPHVSCSNDISSRCYIIRIWRSMVLFPRYAMSED